MKIVELRRHSISDKTGGISPLGINLIKKCQSILNHPYNFIFSSPKQRALQTAIAFGFENVITIPAFSTIPKEITQDYQDKVDEILKTENLTLLEAYFKIEEIRKNLYKFGQDLFNEIKKIAKNLPKNSKAFGISHGGTIEPAVIYAVVKEIDSFNLNVIGGEFKECEGASFIFDDEDNLCGVNILKITLSPY